MIGRRTRLAGLALGTWLAAGGAGRGAAPPLTNEDIVRMVVTGVSEKQIVERIAEAAVDFQLEPAMQAELREAGVGEPILEAMRRRQAAMPRREPPPRPAPPPGITGSVEIVFEPAAGEGPPAERSVAALAALPPRLERRGGQEVATMSDLAFALLCLTPEHVPDHWDLRSPIVQAPRHELLLFRAGSARAKVRGFELIYLDRDDTYRADLAAGAHRLLVVAAGRQAGPGTWRILAADEAAAVVVAPGAVTLLTMRAGSRLSGSALKGFELNLEWKVVAVAPADAAPAKEAA